MRKRLEKAGVFLLFCLFFIISACGTSEGQGAKPTTESNWQLGQGELLDTIGTTNAPTADIPKQTMFFDYDEAWKQTEYKEPTGKWFLHNGAGTFGYGLTTGTQKANSEFYVSLFGHSASEDKLDRNIRIQLTTRDARFTKVETIYNEVIYVKSIKGEEKIFTGNLPEEENVFYILSAEILDQNGNVEDTRISSIYVPTREMNAKLDIKIDSKEQATLTLENFGPTILFLGKYYSIEKKVENEWRVIPLETAFEDIGILLSVGDKFEQTVDISEFSVGEYRIIKDFNAEGLDDLKATLAAEFQIN